jgi:hypothetical protein
VLQSFTASEKGAEPVDRTTEANIIKPAPGKQAAVTIGGGINIDELNKELRQSGLYTIGAAHGMHTLGKMTQTNGNEALSRLQEAGRKPEAMLL